MATVIWKNRCPEAGGIRWFRTLKRSLLPQEPLILPRHPRDDNIFSGQILPVDDQWWKAFNDPVLDSLISVASGENYSVLAAIDRMEQARASLRMERSNFFPSITLNGGWLRQQSSGNTTELPQSITHYYDASLNASWELDIFGSIRQRVKAQRETFQASREEYISVQVSLCAQVASAYINLAGAAAGTAGGDAQLPDAGGSAQHHRSTLQHGTCIETGCSTG